jgi:hypothetical protein
LDPRLVRRTDFKSLRPCRRSLRGRPLQHPVEIQCESKRNADAVGKRVVRRPSCRIRRRNVWSQRPATKNRSPASVGRTNIGALGRQWPVVEH